MSTASAVNYCARVTTVTTVRPASARPSGLSCFTVGRLQAKTAHTAPAITQVPASMVQPRANSSAALRAGIVNDAPFNSKLRRCPPRAALANVARTTSALATKTALRESPAEAIVDKGNAPAISTGTLDRAKAALAASCAALLFRIRRWFELAARMAAPTTHSATSTLGELPWVRSKALAWAAPNMIQNPCSFGKRSTMPRRRLPKPAKCRVESCTHSAFAIRVPRRFALVGAKHWCVQ